jgi:hypothetical protein
VKEIVHQENHGVELHAQKVDALVVFLVVFLLLFLVFVCQAASRKLPHIPASE